MPTILGARVSDRFIELSSAAIDSFGQLFDIDSVNLLLGKNGSGKTRLLTTLARAIASPRYNNAKVYYSNDRHTLSGDPVSRDDVCAIYYSALPYKRKLRRRAGLIDASPTVHTAHDAGRLLRIGEVARDLGIDTRLTAFFGYSRNLFRSVLIPALSREKIIDPELRDMITHHNRLGDEDRETTDRSARMLDNEQEAAFVVIERYLEDEITNRIGGYDKILFLTCLEYLSERANYTQAITNTFLDYIGVTKSDSQMDNFYKLEDIVEKTRSVLDNYGNPNDFFWSNKINHFQIDSIWALDAIRQQETPIKIEWSNLSSGLHALVEQFSLIDSAISQATTYGRSSILLLIDEGDAYLHLDWQRKYISLINKYLGKMKVHHRLESLQLVLATHSPLLAADVPDIFVTNLDASTTGKTFAAPIEEVIANSFESSSLGEFAAKKINQIYRRAQEKKLTEADRNVISAIGDAAIRAAFKEVVQG